MRKIISFMHVSLDGFVSGVKGEMDWIKVDEEIFDFVGKRISESDTAMYGRVTYQMMEAYWPNAGEKAGASKHDKEHSKWYNKAKKIVISRSLAGLDLVNTQIISENLAEKIHDIRNGTGNEILLFGSPGATHSLMQLQLIDGFWLFLNPVLLGQGVPLFANVRNKINLKLLNSSQFSCGVTELNYIVDR